MRRRNFIALLGSAAAAWPLAARAQQSAKPIVGLVNSGSREMAAARLAAFRKGLNEVGYVEDQNVTVEYHWLEGRLRMQNLEIQNKTPIDKNRGKFFFPLRF